MGDEGGSGSIRGAAANPRKADQDAIRLPILCSFSYVFGKSRGCREWCTLFAPSLSVACGRVP
jgi:hypothetical protein